MFNTLQALAAHTDLKDLTALQLSRAFSLISCLKRDITIPQPLSEAHNCPPTFLPPAIAEFLADSLSMSVDLVKDLWEILREEVWVESPKDEPGKDDEECFRQFGWKRELTSMTLYPPEEVCSNAYCLQRGKTLKKTEFREVVVYTLAMGACRAYSAHLFCTGCNTNYHHNFSVCNGKRTYYGGMPKYLQVGEHQFVNDKLIELWINLMLLGWMSAKNCALAYDRALSLQQQQDANENGWRFGMKLTTEHVWDAFVLWSLLGQHNRNNQLVVVPHTGDQKDRFTELMQKRNDEIITEGQDEISHYCDKCMRVWEDENGNLSKCQVVVTDGVAIGHPCCGIFRCTKPLQNNRHRFCQDHFDEHDICAITGCKRPIHIGMKTCDDPAHQKIEKLHVEKGKAAFALTERLKQQQRFQYEANSNSSQEPSSNEQEQSEDLEEDETWFEMDSTSGNVNIFTVADPGTVAGGTSDAASETIGEPASPCPAIKSEIGNKKFKAQFARRKTHNEQTVLFTCGIFAARGTFYGAEAISNVLLFIKHIFSVPRAHKPEHLVYDSNCLAKQQVLASNDTWFKDIGMCVDVWHFLHKHKSTHQFCQLHCNPADYPELMGPDGTSWAFNTSVAEQGNGWINGYSSICREMRAIKYNFFLDEMIRLRNEMTITRLASQGHNPRHAPMPVSGVQNPDL